jgi:hypothetical protein
VRPNRPDPGDASGWSKWLDENRERAITWEDRLYDRLTPEERAEERKFLDEYIRIEQQYEQEDIDMLVRLVKIKNYLWT